MLPRCTEGGGQARDDKEGQDPLIQPNQPAVSSRAFSSEQPTNRLPPPKPDTSNSAVDGDRSAEALQQRDVGMSSPLASPLGDEITVPTSAASASTNMTPPTTQEKQPLSFLEAVLQGHDQQVHAMLERDPGLMEQVIQQAALVFRSGGGFGYGSRSTLFQAPTGVETHEEEERLLARANAPSPQPPAEQAQAEPEPLSLPPSLAVDVASPPLLSNDARQQRAIGAWEVARSRASLGAAAGDWDEEGVDEDDNTAVGEASTSEEGHTGGTSAHVRSDTTGTSTSVEEEEALEASWGLVLPASRSSRPVQHHEQLPQSRSPQAHAPSALRASPRLPPSGLRDASTAAMASTLSAVLPPPKLLRRTALEAAAETGHAKVVRVLLQHGGPSALGPQLGPALLLSAFRGHRDVVQALVEGCGPACPLLEYEDKKGLTALHAAVISDNHEGAPQVLDYVIEQSRLQGRLSLLLERADRRRHRTALMVAARAGRGPQLLSLLEAGATWQGTDLNGPTPLLLALRGGHLPSIQALAGKADEEGQGGRQAALGVRDALGRGPMTYAVLSGKVDVAQWVVQNVGKDAALAERDQAGRTPIFSAAWKDSPQLLEYLLSLGARLDDEDGRQERLLHTAAIAGATNAIRYLLAKGVEVDALSHSGSSALFEAALAGKAQACQVLIDEGHADVNLADVRLFTPLFAAAGFDHCDVVSLLLDRGAHVAQAMFSGATALHYVCQEGFVNCAKLLLEAHAPLETTDTAMHRTPLHSAAQHGSEEMVRLLLGAGALVEPPRIEHADTPLLVAVCNSHAHVARVLLEHGADVRACRRDGASVLHLACDDGHADLVSLLLQYGADVDAVDDKGMTPLWLSVGRGKEACALTLLQHACQVTARRGDGRPGIDVTRLPGGPTATPILHMAAQRGWVDVLRLLVAQGADPKATEPDGTTALRRAVARQQLQCIQVLHLELGCELDVPDQEGFTALYAAVGFNMTRVAEWLLDHGADVNRRQRSLATPLFYAAYSNSLDCARLLLHKGATLQAVDCNNRTALFYAAEEGCVEMIRLLVLEGGMNMDMEDKQGHTAIFAAALAGKMGAVRTLLELGASPTLSKVMARRPGTKRSGMALPPPPSLGK